MLLLAVFVYDPLTSFVSLFLAVDLPRTAVGLFITLARQYTATEMLAYLTAIHMRMPRFT